MSFEEKLKRVREEVSKAIGLIKEDHAGADLKKARKHLKEASEAVKIDDLDQAMSLAEKAQLAAKPTTEYLLGIARKLEQEGNAAYKEGDFSKAIEQWKKSLEDHSRAIELAQERGEDEIIKAVTSTTESIDQDIKTAEKEKSNREMVRFAEEANSQVEEAKKFFKDNEFDKAKAKFESAKDLYNSALKISKDFDFEDKKSLQKAAKDMKTSIEACLIGKGEILIEDASKKEAKDKEDAFSKVIEYLDSFSSKNEQYTDLKQKTHSGLTQARIEIGRTILKDAEDLLDSSEYRESKEGYRKAQDYFEKILEYAVEHRLEEEKAELDRLLEACTTNIARVYDRILGVERKRVTRDEIIRVGDLEDGVEVRVQTKRTLSPIEDELNKLQNIYQAMEYLGFGGFGYVYKVKNRQGVVTAIKIPKSLDKNGEEIFFRELDIWKKLQHRNIVKLIRPHITPVPYFEMEYADGGSLKKLLENTSRLPIEMACNIAFDVACGLEYAHSHRVRHTDLNPKNILLTKTGESKITDWGLGKVAGASSGDLGFTYGYAAPEQILKGKSNEKTDTYQLGLVFYEMLTGDNPFLHGSKPEIEEKTTGMLPEKPSIRRPEVEILDDIILRCLEKSWKKRPRLRDFREAVYNFMKEGYGVSLHLSEDIDTITNIYCRYALQAAKINDHKECIMALQYLMRKVSDPETRDIVKRLVGEVEYRRNRKIDLEQIMDEIDGLLRRADFEG
ncbi:MAG: protein kinase [Candidatus Hydrothermarchaeales archaeon]